MKTPLTLTIDIGTQSTRAMLVAPDGSIRAFERKKYDAPYFSEHPGWAENSPDFYFNALSAATKELTAKNRELLPDIIAVTLTTIRDTSLCLDKDGKPLRNIITWMDKRETAEDNPYPFYINIATAIVGMKDSMVGQYRQAACNWIMENQKEIWAKTDKFVMISTYLNFLLTGNLIDTPANMIAHIPFYYKKRTWHRKGSLMYRMTPIPHEKLPKLCGIGEEIGKITADASEKTGIPEGLPFIASGSDKGCETIGIGVIHKNQAAVSFGSSATVQFTTDKYFSPRPFLPSYPAVIPGMYNPEVQIYRGYWMISWYKDEFGHPEAEEAKKAGVIPETILNSHLNDVPPGSEGLVLQPFWGPGVENPNARGAIVGFSDVHNRYHVYRAIIEGIDFGLYNGLRSMEKRSGQRISEIRVAGGGSQSDEICQILADIFGIRVVRVQSNEGSGIGASMVGFVAKGVFKSFEEAVEAMVHTKDVFNPDPKAHALYDELYRTVYEKVAPRLDPLYRRMKPLLRKLRSLDKGRK